MTAPLVHLAVAAQARRTPDAPAVTGGGAALIYRELDEQSNRLAHHLVGLGVGPEVRVGVHLDRSADLVVALLAVHKAGGAYVPLDPAYPLARLRFMVADRGAAVVVGRNPELAVLADPNPAAEAGPALVCLDRDAAGIAAEPGDRPPPDRTEPSHLAYVLYTSGSTGNPKGVLVEQRSLANLVQHVATAYGIGPGDRGGVVCAVSFDVLMWEIWPQLVRGGAVVPVDGATRLDPAAVVRWLHAEQVTVAFLPPALYELVIVRPELDSTANPVPLRVLMTGGDVARRRPRPDTAFPVENIYGPTETTVVATTATVLDQRREDGVIPIGTAITGCSAVVLDDRLRPVPDGEPGELCVGGLGVGRGYHALPRLTAERFVPDPAGPPDARMYRTGDRATVRPDGQLVFLGRLDRQVQVRGFRVEPAEIEHVLLDHPAVGLSAIDARDQQLVGYVVPRSGWRPDDDLAARRTDTWRSVFPAGELANRPLQAAHNAALSRQLRDFLGERLPEHMVPATFVVLDELPLTPSGKVDRLRLPDVVVPGGERFAPPRTPTEEVITAMAVEVLGRPRLGVLDDLVALGAHSVNLAQLANRIADAIGVELPVRALLEAPTVAEIARRVEDLVISEVRAEFGSRKAAGTDGA